MRKPVIAGNWKCHKTQGEAVELIRQLRQHLDAVREVEVLVCPTFTSLAAAAGALKGSSIGLAAQDLFWEVSGAFTGEVSAPMLVETGCQYVIIGHSERRQHFHETDEQANKKLLASLSAGLKPIVCIGETLEQRENGQTLSVVGHQLNQAMQGMTFEQVKQIVIAYEPVWAIGTGRTATAAQAQEVHAFIRTCVQNGSDASTAAAVRIQYGGSVNAANALELLQQPDVDGALVGGASLKAEAFTAIVRAAVEAKVSHKPAVKS